MTQTKSKSPYNFSSFRIMTVKIEKFSELRMPRSMNAFIPFRDSRRKKVFYLECGNTVHIPIEVLRMVRGIKRY